LTESCCSECATGPGNQLLRAASISVSLRLRSEQAMPGLCSPMVSSLFLRERVFEFQRRVAALSHYRMLGFLVGAFNNRRLGLRQQGMNLVFITQGSASGNRKRPKSNTGSFGFDQDGAALARRCSHLPRWPGTQIDCRCNAECTDRASCRSAVRRGELQWGSDRCSVSWRRY
jgi:hypothetical protein